MTERRVTIGDLVLGPDERAELADVIASGRVSEGPKVRAFEELWASYVGTREAVAVNSGTSALIAGLLALQLSRDAPLHRGMRVITTPLSYAATSNAILLSGCEPVYVDVDPETLCITPGAVRAYLEGLDDPAGHGALLPVHLMGYACDMDGLSRVARDYGLALCEGLFDNAFMRRIN